MSSLAVVHNPHSTNCKTGKLENRNLVMSFPSLNSITLRKEFRAGAVNTLQSSSSSDAHCTQAPTCAVPFVGLANLIQSLPCHPPSLEPTAPDPVQLTSLLCTITLPKDFLDLSGWNTQESTHLLHSSFQHKLHKN